MPTLPPESTSPGAPARSRRSRLPLALPALLVATVAAGLLAPGDALAPGVLSPPPASCADASSPLEAAWIPPRPDSAATGSAFGARTRGWNGRSRQQAALAELRGGDIPPFLRTLVPVRLEARGASGATHRAIIWVTPDYLSIGSDDDYLRIPLTRPTAVTIARELGFVLPTRRIVDEIHRQADVRLEPMPLPPGPTMRSSEYYLRHNGMIQKALGGRAPGKLVAGHKKDVVLTGRLTGDERIAIYGWHRLGGRPIQPLSTVHDARYADYSHGIRLVYQTACVDGKPMSIYDVLENRELAPLLTYEGWMTRFRKLMRW